MIAALLLACAGGTPGDTGDTSDDTSDTSSDTSGDTADTFSETSGDTSSDTADTPADTSVDTSDTSDTVRPWLGEHTADEGDALTGAPGEMAGHALAVGDVDGDGLPDLLVLAPGNDGSAWLVRGPIAGGALATASAAVLRGPSALQAFNGGTALLADLDGDALDDIVLGAPGGGYYGSAGAVWVAPGASTGEVEPTAVLSGEDAWDGAGTALAAGDLDGDGRNDLLVGAPGHPANTRAGRVYLAPGPVVTGSLLDSTLTFDGDTADDRAGNALLAADLDGDGLPEAVIGAPGTERGDVYVLDGRLSGALTSADADRRLTGEADDDHAGGSLAAGDLDGDGLPELLVGADAAGADGVGAVYAVGPGGSLAGAYARIDLVGDWPPGALTLLLADLDGDGTPALVVGASPQLFGRSGGDAWVHLSVPAGVSDTSAADAHFTGVALDDRLGVSLAAIDLDADGALDLLLGAVGDDTAGADAGAVYLFGSTE